MVGLSVDGETFPVTIEQGQTLDLGYSYANEGLGDATLSVAAPLVNRIHLSFGSTAATSADILVEGTRTADLVAGGSSFLGVGPRTVLLAPGTYQVVLEVDATDNVVEADEGNNEIVAGTVTVVASTVAEDCANGIDDDFDGAEDCDDSECAADIVCEPDLVPLSLDGLSLPTTVADGSSITLGYSYQNAGGGPTTGISVGSPMANRVHLSPTTSADDSVAVILSATRTSNLNPGQSSALSPVAVTLTAPAGTWNVLVSVDDDDVVGEGFEGNNVLVAGTLTVTN